MPTKWAYFEVDVALDEHDGVVGVVAEYAEDSYREPLCKPMPRRPVDALNHYGSLGWELCSTQLSAWVDGGSMITYLFKRPYD